MTYRRLKQVASIKVSNVDKKSVEGEPSVRLCNYTDVYYNDRITSGLEYMQATATPEQIRQFELIPGDVVITKDSETPDDIAVPALVAESVPGLVCGYHLAVVRPGSAVEGRYLLWALAGSQARTQMASAATGVTRFGLRYDSIGDVAIWVPDLARQRAIADYLDADTARIDALIDKKTRMASLLDERLTRLSSETVSQGPRVRVRHLTSLVTSGPRGWAEHVSDEGRPFIRSANLRPGSIEVRTDNLAFVQVPNTAESRRSSVRAGDVVIGITGANVGWLGIVPETLAGSFVSQHVAILRPSGVDPEWLANSLAADQAQDQLLGGQYGGTKQQLGLEDLAELRIGFPSQHIQRESVARLRAERRNHGALHERLVQQIGLLREHRQALITAAVSGCLGVPGVAA